MSCQVLNTVLRITVAVGFVMIAGQQFDDKFEGRSTLLPAESNSAGTDEIRPETTRQLSSTRSAPPDTTLHVRPTVPEDYAPGGRNAIPPGTHRLREGAPSVPPG